MSRHPGHAWLDMIQLSGSTQTMWRLRRVETQAREKKQHQLAMIGNRWRRVEKARQLIEARGNRWDVTDLDRCCGLAGRSLGADLLIQQTSHYALAPHLIDV